MSTIEERVAALENAVYGHSTELAKLILRVDAIDRKLDEHTVKLDEHAVKLDAIDRKLDEHAVKLDTLIESQLAQHGILKAITAHLGLP